MRRRYNIHDDPWLPTLLRELGVEGRIPTRVDIAPTEPVPVVFEEEGRRCLREEDFARWLDVETPLGDPSEILRSRLPHPFVLAPLSPAINNSRHKNDALLAPVGEEERVEAVEQ